MNCSPLRALTLRSPCAPPRSSSCAPVEAMCLRIGTAVTSVGAASASGWPALGVTTPALGAVEIEGADFTPPSLATRLGGLPSFVALSEPANASVENAIRLTPAATENLGMRFTLHVIHERRYGGSAQTRNAFRSKPCLGDRTEFLVQASRRQSFKTSHVRHLQRAQAVCLVRETPYPLKN